MSLFSNRAGLYVYQGRTGLAVCRVTGRWRPRLDVQAVLPVDIAAPWKAPQVLAEWLQGQAMPAAGALHVTLGYAQAPVLMLPWAVEMAEPAFRERLALALFEQQLQMPATACRVVLGPCRYRRPTVAACLDLRLHEGWRSMAGQSGLKLATLQPMLVSVWDRFQAEWSRQPGRLLLLEEDRIWQVTHRDGHIQQVGMRPGDGEVLARMMQAEMGQECHVMAPDDVVSGLPPLTKHLRLQTEGNTYPYVFALCGAF